MFLFYTGLCNHNRIVFEEMSSWTALRMDLGMEPTFKTKYIHIRQTCSDF